MSEENQIVTWSEIDSDSTFENIFRQLWIPVSSHATQEMKPPVAKQSAKLNSV